MNFLVLCIGNREGGDDAVGPYIADQLKKHNNIPVIDCGINPENYTAVVKRQKPQQLILVDAVEMGLHPGEIRIIPKEKIGRMHISTHGIPLSVLIDYLEQYVTSVVLVGIQPKVMTGDMTETIRRSGDAIVQLLQKNAIQDIQILK